VAALEEARTELEARLSSCLRTQDHLEATLSRCLQRILELHNAIGSVPYTSISEWNKDLEGKIEALAEEAGVVLDRAPRFQAVPAKEAK
jgi:capsid protein